MELALRILLAAVLAWAAVAKLRAGPRFAASLGDLGVPRRARAPLAVTVSLVELGLAIVLLLGVATRQAGIAVAALGAVFTLALLRTRVRGRRRTSCGCFGGTRPASTMLLAARAAVLGALGAVLAVGVPTVDAPNDGRWQTAAIALLAGMVVALALAVLALYRQVGVLSLRLAPRTALELEDEGPPIGQIAPLLPGLARAGSELVAFVSLDCRMCIELLPGLRALEREGTPVRWLREDREEEAFDAWGVPGTPYVVHVVDGVVRAKGLVNTLEQIDWVLDVGAERSRLAA